MRRKYGSVVQGFYVPAGYGCKIKQAAVLLKKFKQGKSLEEALAVRKTAMPVYRQNLRTLRIICGDIGALL